MHTQTLTKTPERFQTDPSKTVGGVAFKRVDTFCDGQSDRQTDARGRNKKMECVPERNLAYFQGQN